MFDKPLHQQFSKSMLDTVRSIMEGKPFPDKKKDDGDAPEKDSDEDKKDVAGSADTDSESTVSGGGRTPVDTDPKTDDDVPGQDDDGDAPEKDKEDPKKKKASGGVTINIKEAHALYTVKGNGKGSKVSLHGKHPNGLAYKIKHNGQMKWVPKHMLSNIKEDAELNEISNEKLGSYLKKNDATVSSHVQAGMASDKTGDIKGATKHYKKWTNRLKGAALASRKMRKEDVDDMPVDVKASNDKKAFRDNKPVVNKLSDPSKNEVQFSPNPKQAKHPGNK